MREAMARAELGDDQFGEDPTVRRLEERSAEVMGKEAGLFVASGIMGNLCGILSQAQRGDEVILGDLSHIFQNEVGAYAVFGGLYPRPIPNGAGCPSPSDIRATVRPEGIGFPRSALLCLENTHNWLSGAPVAEAETRMAAEVARRSGLAIHLDGARIFNAALALETEAKDLVAPVDTVQFCFSKGLAAPVGSMLCGPKAVIDRARKIRKMLGGAMRQAGVIAAACQVALDTMRERLAEDHANARALAGGLARIPGLLLDPSRVRTNIVAFDLAPGIDALALRDRAQARGLRYSCYGGNWSRARMVTHWGLDAASVDEALSILAQAL
jgi:threonine aldolase